jgi:diacylglycerol kinase (ATP)
LGIGFDAVVTIRSHRLPVLRGFLMYLTAVIQTIMLNHDPARVHFETDQERWEDSVLMTTLCNGGREGGGFTLSPDSRMTDGVMEYLTVRKVSRGMMFRLVPEFMNGTHRRFTKQIRMGACKRFNMSSDRPLYIHADGEILTSFAATAGLNFEIVPGALKVVQVKLGRQMVAPPFMPDLLALLQKHDLGHLYIVAGSGD